MTSAITHVFKTLIYLVIFDEKIVNNLKKKKLMKLFPCYILLFGKLNIQRAENRSLDRKKSGLT